MSYLLKNLRKTAGGGGVPQISAKEHGPNIKAAPLQSAHLSGQELYEFAVFSAKSPSTGSLNFTPP